MKSGREREHDDVWVCLRAFPDETKATIAPCNCTLQLHPTTFFPDESCRLQLHPPIVASSGKKIVGCNCRFTRDKMTWVLKDIGPLYFVSNYMTVSALICTRDWITCRGCNCTLQLSFQTRVRGCNCRVQLQGVIGRPITPLCACTLQLHPATFFPDETSRGLYPAIAGCNCSFCLVWKGP